MSLLSPAGQVVTRAQIHNVYINCAAICWAYPSVFENNRFSSDFIHVVDQYVGSEAYGCYRLGPSLAINYPITA